MAFAILVKSTIWLGATGLVAALCRRASAATRHVLWAVGLASVLVVAGIEVLGPTVELGVLPRAPSPATARAEAQTSRAAEMAPPVIAGTEGASPATAPPTGSGEPGKAAGVFSTARIPLRALFLVWLAGAALVWSRALVGVRNVRRLASSAVSADAGLEETLTGLRTAMKVPASRRIDIRLVNARVSPMVWGAVSPTILLPSEARSWTRERQRVVVAHELAHIFRRDIWTQWLVQLVAGAYWMHPLVWYGVGRLRIEGERACDDRVIGLGADPEDYADHLLQLTRTLGGRVFPAALPMASPSQLEVRLRAILDPHLGRRTMSRAGGTGFTVLGVVLAAIVGMGQPVAAGGTGVPETSGNSEISSVSLRPPEPEAEPEAEPVSGSRPQAEPVPVPGPSPPRAGNPLRPIQVNDVLRIDVFGEADLSRSVRVTPDGRVSIPLLQSIRAEGRVLPELRDVIQAGLSQYIAEPNVTVALEEAEPYTFYVTGSVRNPGAFESPNRLTVLQALAMAGGLSESADPGSITVVRSGEDGDTIFGFDYLQAIRGDGAGQNFRLEPGDVVAVRD